LVHLVQVRLPHWGLLPTRLSSSPFLENCKGKAGGMRCRAGVRTTTATPPSPTCPTHVALPSLHLCQCRWLTWWSKPESQPSAPVPWAFQAVCAVFSIIKICPLVAPVHTSNSHQGGRHIVPCLLPMIRIDSSSQGVGGWAHVFLAW
jgi:hypothetical protein